MTASHAMPLVRILLCTYNGAAYLPAQLESIARQTYGSWQLVISDDGSKDATLKLAADFARRWPPGQVIMRQGPRQGFACNFLSTLHEQPLDGAFYAWADQDDVWMPEKLARAMAALETLDPERPALFCSSTELVDDIGRIIGYSPVRQHAPGLRNALIENIAGGNTMVFNEAAKKALDTSATDSLPAHDWYTYLAVAAMNGHIRYDRKATIQYRQHDNNLKGVGTRLTDRWQSIVWLTTGGFRDAVSRNMTALEMLRNCMPPEQRKLLHDFQCFRRSGIWSRITSYRQLGLYRQTWWGQWGCRYAVLFGLI